MTLGLMSPYKPILTRKRSDASKPTEMVGFALCGLPAQQRREPFIAIRSHPLPSGTSGCNHLKSREIGLT